eukprot:2150320-Lingulodinium_polyedra.AAC.1
MVDGPACEPASSSALDAPKHPSTLMQEFLEKQKRTPRSRPLLKRKSSCTSTVSTVAYEESVEQDNTEPEEDLEVNTAESQCVYWFDETTGKGQQLKEGL